MRHRKFGRHLARTSAHNRAMRRNLAQSLFEHGQITTTLIKAKEVRGFVEKLITLARKGAAGDKLVSLRARQRIAAALGDRAVIPADQQEKYEGMSSAHRTRVLRARSGRRHRTGTIPAAYNKKKIPFVATSIVHRLMTDIAPRYADRPGGYTRIIRLAKRRIGDMGELAILQLVGEEEAARGDVKQSPGARRQRVDRRIKALKAAAKKDKAKPAAGE
ncbi:MAG: 50S ribosomal protein L17 [Phycisphaerae bacterium]